MPKTNAMIVDADTTVTLDVDTYMDMLERCAWLEYLEAAGVDNWEGIDHAAEIARADGFFDGEDD